MMHGEIKGRNRVGNAWRVCIAGIVLALWSGSLAAQYSSEGGLERIQPADGLQVELFASEPMIVNPISVDVDPSGRVWVTEGVNYRKNVKIPPDNAIKVLEDTDGDGKADKVTVFTADLNASMSVCVAGDQIFVAESPNLYVYEDKNHDLKPDGPRKTLLTGFGGVNHDHGLHGLMLGPDHKLYMTVGDGGYDVTGPDGNHVKFQWGGFLRCELDGTQLEALAVNFRNPFELAVDSFGRVWCSDNDNDGLQSVRICWILEGGNYGWFGRPEPIREVDGSFLPLHHWRIDQPGFVPYARITGFGSPSGMTCYEGDAFGADLKGKLIHCDPGPRVVRCYTQKPREGLGFTCDQRNLLTSTEDNYFRPVDVCAAPDGALFITDWYDGGVGGHNYNDPTRGRIYRVTPKGKQLEPKVVDRSITTLKDALAGFRSPNLSTAFLARGYLLAHPEEAVSELALLDLSNDPISAARRLWILDRCGEKGLGIVLDALKSKDAATRAQAIRMLRREGAKYQQQILTLATDRAPEVRTEVLLALRGFDDKTALKLWNQLATDYDGTDRMYLEALKVAAQGRETEVYTSLKLDEKSNWSERDVQYVQILKPEEAVQKLASRLSKKTDETEELVLLGGIRTSPNPEAGKAVVATLDGTDSSAVRNLALDGLRQRLLPFWNEETKSPQLIDGLQKALKDQNSMAEALAMLTAARVHSHELETTIVAIAEDDANDPQIRTAALGLIAQERIAQGAKTAYALLTSKEAGLQSAALKVLTALADGKRMNVLLNSTEFSDDMKVTAVKQLAESAHGGVVLFRMVELKQIPEGLAQEAIRLGVENADINVRLLFGKYVPESERPKRLGDQVTPEQILELTGDAKKGERIFSQGGGAACNKCHRIQGKGADIGPELSLIGKKYERRALLETIINPSSGIAPEYYPYVVEMESGRIFGGFALENTKEQVVLKTIEGEVLTLPRKEIVEMVKQNVSLMPDAILKEISAQDAADLLEYLTTLK